MKIRDVMPGVSADEGLALTWAAWGLLRDLAPEFQLSLLGTCSKEEPQYLKLGRPMGHTTEEQCSKGLILPYCEIMGQHIFLTKPAPNGRRTRDELNQHLLVLDIIIEPLDAHKLAQTSP
ncbi:hypothetical protein llap_2356 [Limosa lapponica baueri]|uniref:Uncharacterized protein n=1 Tax=Limosa lapponica baueri TaxID=1758121 RepID=A0A2I0UMT4_LIMLA|nr:hypothetical protein llap_2356 [Limosa lapponica baueri]